ncbi:TonB-dependent receptor [uncultured Maricaulis sp.]|uniref:TonB-dependent receptor n=1 Tax=uncultured Maricaulis sp. TaxID=174710 RepID=UPI0030D7DCF0|tara:strand:- start:17500 stop:20082 length:2583 start_codon:yes stop_codon:yes gene_type:complete
MLKKRALTTTILSSALLASVATGIAAAQVETITVTATKREASTQSIPIAVNAMGESTLEELRVNVFTDYLQQLPGVTAGGSGPGQNTIYIRGLASTTPNLTTAGVAGLAPNVAFYLDEQPLGQPGRNLDVYAADINRVEVLPGPQGTLYGASSQAGTVRMITNAPVIGEFEASASFGTSFTENGDMSSNVEAVINLPVSENFALRGVVYYDSQGGYIDNVAGTRSARESARFRTAGTVRSNGVPVSANRAGFQAGADLTGVTFIDADNAALVEEDFNDTTYQGFRISGLWDISSDFSLRVTHTRQDLDSDGVFFADPTLGDLEIQRYEQDEMEDAFHNTSWTLEGRLGMLDAVYTGAYTDRETNQRVDYSDYLFVGQYLPYYICDGSVSYPGGAPSGTCQAPNLFVDSTTDTTVFTQELRFNTPEDRRFRATFGGFYSELELAERNDFTYPGSVNAVLFGQTGFSPNYPFTTGYTSDPGPFPAGVIFRNDVLRTDVQSGVFGEASFDLNDQFSITVGTRYYDIEVDLEGSANASFCNGFQPDANAYGTDISDLYNGDGAVTFRGSCNTADHITYTDPNTAGIPASAAAALAAPDAARTDGFIFKATGQWTPRDGMLFYATYSEGFRPGLLNRPGGAAGPGGYTVPFALESDEVTNYELGWKLDLADNQLRFNGNVFFVDIENLQTTIFDPSIVNLFFSDNAANAEIRGFEGDVTWAPMDMPGLTVTGAFSMLDTEITEVLTPTDDVLVGSELAFAPGFQGNIRARYEWELDNGLTAHVMPQLIYSGDSVSDVIEINKIDLDAYTMASFSTGLTSDGWSIEAFVNNLTDERAQLSNNFVYDRERVTIARPRTWGMRVRVQY